MLAGYGRCNIAAKPNFKESLHLAINDSDTPMPYSLLDYPDITPPQGSEERQMGWFEAMRWYTGIHSGAAQVAAEVEGGVRSALPSAFSQPLPPPPTLFPEVRLLNPGIARLWVLISTTGRVVNRFGSVTVAGNHLHLLGILQARRLVWCVWGDGGNHGEL